MHPIQSPSSYYWSAVMSDRPCQHEAAMSALAAERPIGSQYLEKIPKSLWTNAFFPVPTWDETTSNLAEQQVNWIGKDHAREQPPSQFLANIALRTAHRHESIREKMMKRAKIGARITKYADGLFQKELSESGNYVSDVVSRTDTEISYSVLRNGKQATSSGVGEDYHRVSLNTMDGTMICSRNGRWCHPQNIPCRHMLSVLRKPAHSIHLDTMFTPENVGKWFPSCFLMLVMVEAYDVKHAINPATTQYDRSNLLPPALLYDKPQTGRASSDRRISSRQQHHTGDVSGVKPRYCSKCGCWEHTVRTCPYIDLDDQQIEQLKVSRIVAKAESIFDIRRGSSQKPTPIQWHWAQTMMDLDYVEADLGLRRG